MSRLFDWNGIQSRNFDGFVCLMEFPWHGQGFGFHKCELVALLVPTNVDVRMFGQPFPNFLLESAINSRFGCGCIKCFVCRGYWSSVGFTIVECIKISEDIGYRSSCTGYQSRAVEIFLGLLDTDVGECIAKPEEVSKLRFEHTTLAVWFDCSAGNPHQSNDNILRKSSLQSRTARIKWSNRWN